MGDYASLRFRVKLTEEAHMALVMAEKVYFQQDLPNQVYFWEIVRGQGLKIPKEFIWNWRSGQIPYGGSVREDWGDPRSDIEPATHRWNVVCATKDEKMAQLFCEEVLPLLIAEPCTVDLWFELWSSPKLIEVSPHRSAHGGD